MPDEQQHSSNLKAARASSLKNSAQNVKKNIKAAANIASLMTYIDPFMDWLFGIALSVALLKDILDLVGFGSFPAIGTVVTLMASATIALIMFITGSGSKAKMIKGLVKSGAKRYGVLVFGTIIEMIFGIDFLPIETTVVIIVFILTLQERRSASLNRT